MRIKAVIFDLDDTLIHSGLNHREIKGSIIDFLAKSGVNRDLLSESMPNFEIITRAVEDLRSKNVPENVIGEIASKVNVMLNEAELRSLGKARLMEGAIEVLEHLKSLGLKVGILTNSCSAYANRAIEMFSLRKYVDALITRDDISYPKPNPGHLLKILEVLGVGASEAVFVGDHLIDALCASGCGVKFVLLRNAKWNVREWEKMASAVISDLSQIPSIIQSL